MADDLIELIIDYALYGMGGTVLICISPVIILGIIYKYLYIKIELFAFNHDWIKDFHG